jgi:hypothetical protein
LCSRHYNTIEERCINGKKEEKKERKKERKKEDLTHTAGKMKNKI